MKYLLMTLFSCALLFSCDKEDNNSEFEYIFGSYAGECFGNCANFYKLEDESLYADDMEYFTHSLEEFTFKNSALEQSKYILAKEFYEDLPNELIESTEITFGIPDAYDQGGYFIVYIENNDTLFWNIDTNKEVLPEYLKNYIEKLEVLMPQLSE